MSDRDASPELPATPRPIRDAVLGMALLLPAVPVGLFQASVRPDAGGEAIASPAALVVLAGYAVVLLVVALGAARTRRDPVTWSLYLAWALISLALAAYVAWVESLVRYPADILIWAESNFVQDITHLRSGVPLYDNPEHLASLFYPPLNQLATYALATVFGHPLSVAAYRVIQLAWMALAAGLAVGIVRDILTLAGHASQGIFARHPRLASAVVAGVVFLVGTNPITHPFAHNLHDDSIAVLISTAAFLMLTRYAVTRRQGYLVAFAVLPGLGFLAKQSMAIWAPLGAGTVALLGGAGWFRRAAMLGAVALALVLLPMFCGGVLWGEGWHFWIIETLGAHPVSPARSLHHALLTAAFSLLGIVALLVLWHGRDRRGLLVCWAAWLLLLATQTYTSGIAWMLNHIAPASMLAGTWAAAALAGEWPRMVWRSGVVTEPPLAWARGTVVPIALTLALAVLGVVRVPEAGLGADADAYRKRLEQAVAEGRSTGAPVLLDHGSWVFVKERESVGDRSAAVGELGYSGVDVFQGMRDRIASQHYGRIILRNYRAPSFIYDDSTWHTSSGIRPLLEEHYVVVDSFPGLEQAGQNPFLKPVWVLEPRPGASPP